MQLESKTLPTIRLPPPPIRGIIIIMSTINVSTEVNTIDQKITLFGSVIIDELIFGIEKNESCGCTCYYITVTPLSSGASSFVKSDGCAIRSDDEAIKFLERLEKFKHSVDKTMLYCGIEERNGSEGETFGYYFPQNETTLALVQKIEQRWDENELCEDNNYSFVYDATREELDIVEKYSCNSYMSRVNFCESEKSLNALRVASISPWFPYKGTIPESLDENGQGVNWHDLAG